MQSAAPKTANDHAEDQNGEEGKDLTNSHLYRKAAQGSEMKQSLSWRIKKSMAEKFSQEIKMTKKETNRTAGKGSINIVITIIISKQFHSGKKSATCKKSRTDLRGTGQRQDNNIHLYTYK